MDGILKHTSIQKDDKKWDINRFTQSVDQLTDFMKYKYPVTLEGQVVAVADEIAQRQHDLMMG